MERRERAGSSPEEAGWEGNARETRGERSARPGLAAPGCPGGMPRRAGPGRALAPTERSEFAGRARERHRRHRGLFRASPQQPRAPPPTHAPPQRPSPPSAHARPQKPALAAVPTPPNRAHAPRRPPRVAP